MRVRRGPRVGRVEVRRHDERVGRRRAPPTRRGRGLKGTRTALAIARAARVILCHDGEAQIVAFVEVVLAGEGVRVARLNARGGGSGGARARRARARLAATAPAAQRARAKDAHEQAN